MGWSQKIKEEIENISTKFKKIYLFRWHEKVFSDFSLTSFEL